MSDHTHEWETVPSGHECRICGCSRETAPDQPKAPPQRVSDYQLASDIQHVRHYGHRAHDTLMLPAGYIGDLRDARIALADDQTALVARDARIAGLEAERNNVERNAQREINAVHLALDKVTDRADRLEAQLQAARAAGTREDGLREAAEIADDIKPAGNEVPTRSLARTQKRVAAAIRARLTPAEPTADTGEKG